MRHSLSKSRLFPWLLLLAFLTSSLPAAAGAKGAFMGVSGLKAGHSNRIEANNNPVNYRDPLGLTPGTREAVQISVRIVFTVGAEGTGTTVLSRMGPLGLAAAVAVGGTYLIDEYVPGLYSEAPDVLVPRSEGIGQGPKPRKPKRDKKSCKKALERYEARLRSMGFCPDVGGTREALDKMLRDCEAGLSTRLDDFMYL